MMVVKSERNVAEKSILIFTILLKGGIREWIWMLSLVHRNEW